MRPAYGLVREEKPPYAQCEPSTQRMRAPSADATSSTASCPVAFSRSRIGLTSTTSSESRSAAPRRSPSQGAPRGTRAPAHGRADAGRVVGIDHVDIERDVEEGAPDACASASRMHGSIPIRSTSLIVKTFASSSQQLPLSLVERTDADERDLVQLDRRQRPPFAREPSPASPSAAARTIPWTLPLGDVSRRVEVAVGVDPDDAARTALAFAIPISEPSATEWSPPRTSGNAPRPAHPPRAPRAGDRDRGSRRGSARSPRRSAAVSATGEIDVSRVADPHPELLRQLLLEPRIANRGGPHVDAAPARAEVEGPSDHRHFAGEFVHSRRGG